MRARRQRRLSCPVIESLRGVDLDGVGGTDFTIAFLASSIASTVTSQIAIQKVQTAFTGIDQALRVAGAQDAPLDAAALATSLLPFINAFLPATKEVAGKWQATMYNVVGWSSFSLVVSPPDHFLRRR